MASHQTTKFAVALILACGAPIAIRAQSGSTPPLVITRNPYYPATPVSPYDSRVSPYSTNGANNPYTTGGGKIYANDGTYLGKLNANKYDSESIANPYGKYGSPYSSTSINNQYGTYGSPYSAQSPNNPYATTPPKVYYPGLGNESAPPKKSAPLFP